MFNQYSASSSSYFGTLQPSKSTTNIGNNRFDRAYPFESATDSKTISRIIEESKENMSKHKGRPVTSASNHPLHNDFSSSYGSREANHRKEWQQPQKDPSMPQTAKSYKCIKFSNQFEREYQLSKATGNHTEDYKNYGSKTTNFKQITQSLDYKTTLKDLIPNFKAEGHKYREKRDKSMKTLTSCKSETGIKFDLEESHKRESPKRPAYGFNSSKKIDFLGDSTFSKKQQKSSPVFTSKYKSSKYIKDEPIRPKCQKTVNYTELLHSETATPALKKTRTLPDSMRQHSSHTKGKLSIHNFEIGPCKGEGAFGQVFLAVHKETKMVVALKKVPKEKVKYMLEQFINEIKIQMFLDHPNIVKLYGFFDDATNFYIIMEYMEGGNVFNLIKQKKKLSEAETVERLKEICLGVKEMHDHSILHRDIKPENIVLTNDVCKLCDFGWAAICTDRRTTYCGTLDYVSPQIIGGEGYDDSVDIWCIGVLAYQMICGKTPFYNISRKETMKKIVNVTYEYPSDISSKSKAFIDKILKKNPDDRVGIEQVLQNQFLQ